MRMTLVYARIADRTVAEEYFAAADKVDKLNTTTGQHHRHKGRGRTRHGERHLG
jgi:hypothetical protein